MIEMILYPPGIKSAIEYHNILKAVKALGDTTRPFELMYFDYLIELLADYEEEREI